MESVVILGASNKPERYSYKAFIMLKEYGHIVVPVNPALDVIDSVPVFHTLHDINIEISTITLYMRSERYMPLIQDMIKLKPTRVIFNPGTESKDAEKMFKSVGVNVINACTLVMLRTGQF